MTNVKSKGEILSPKPNKRKKKKIAMDKCHHKCKK